MELSMNTHKGESQGSRRKAKGITIITDQLRSFWLKHMHHNTQETTQSISVEEILGEQPKVSSCCLDCRQQDRQEEMGKAGKNRVTSPTLGHGQAVGHMRVEERKQHHPLGMDLLPTLLKHSSLGFSRTEGSPGDAEQRCTWKRHLCGQ